MSKKVLNIFKEELKHITVDTKLLKQIEDYKLDWITSRTERMEFLSSHLIGVYPFKFTDADEADFLIDLLDIDTNRLDKLLLSVHEYKMEKRTKSNLYQLVILYLIHLTHISKLNKKDKESFISVLSNLLGYRILSSVMSHNFKFNLDKDIASVVYERLSGKNLIKTEGSWQKVIDHYTSLYIHPGIHAKRLISFTDKEAFNAKNDFKTRLKSIVKVLNKLVYETIENADGRGTYGDFMDGDDGKAMLVDVDDDHNKYYTRVKQKIADKREFVKDDLINIVLSVTSTVKHNDIKSLLNYLTDEFVKHPDKIYSILEEIVKINVEYLYIGKMYPPYNKDLNVVIRYVRGYWNSSSVKHIEAKQVKTKLRKYSTKAVKSTNSKYHPSLVNATIIYIFLLSIMDI